MSRERGRAQYAERIAAEDGVLSSGVLGALMQRSEGNFASADLSVVSKRCVVVSILLRVVVVAVIRVCLVPGLCDCFIFYVTMLHCFCVLSGVCFVLSIF